MRIGYLLVLIIYGIVSVFGAVGVIGYKVGDANCVMDYFNDTSTLSFYFASFCSLLFLFQLTTVLPILVYVARS